MDLQLEGKRALVTGGSRGIGLAVARELLAEGARVAIVARDAATLHTIAGSLGERAVAITADTGDDRSVRDMATRAIELLGGVDILVNAAARPSVPGAKPKLSEITDAELRDELEIKLLGYLRCARALAPGMIKRGWGRIINISGLHARMTGSLIGSVRNVSIAAMTKNLADELGPAGINVTVVHPGYTVTERTPTVLGAIATAQGVSEATVLAGLNSMTSIGRIITAEEVAAVTAFLASPRSVSITGDAIATAGGMRGPIHY
ncbi:SDR family NAD(P)-dependent oxidoreductase [Pseudonocardia spinosispora]|uniref:SDR family NAD(P)-dependent oxidoreductase n=1 Tax=Pseudonocardia spinosispora TaxID=103441 RepID=UPI000423DA59|nr:SDR family oxidoreductase [Pseudonocardia spinosispora]